MNLNQILKKHQAWLDGDPGGVRANLADANLTGANLESANLESANLEWANLTGAILTNANLINANLINANLTGANLEWANLTEANLTGANLIGANLINANLERAILTGAILERANLERAIFDDMYAGIVEDLPAVCRLIVENKEFFSMEAWHRGDWHNGQGRVHDDLCGTAHCMAGFAHVKAAKEDPRLLDPKVNVWLVGYLAMGKEAANKFYGTTSNHMPWIEEHASA